jgi:hypothetical protein
MIKRYFWLTVAFAACIGCSQPKEPTVAAAPSELEKTGEEVRLAQAQLAQSVKPPMDEEKAKQAAARHLALKQIRWGKPVSVSQDEQQFYVSYQTPEQELRLIGSRVLLVNKSTGVVTPQKRR